MAGSGIHQHHRPTDQHLRAILSNPLFKKGIRTTPRADALQKDPMEVFDKAVARGSSVKSIVHTRCYLGIGSWPSSS
ncbi:hypothetical protein HYQ44_013745 [Verticillium longisporum]|nr:hypothetical protein HYQ44_013745 [Verticillium longisporum]